MNGNFKTCILDADNIMSFAPVFTNDQPVMITEENVFGFGALKDDALTCGAVLGEYLPEEESVFVRHLFVTEGARRQGVGTMLIHALMDEAKTRLAGAVGITFPAEDAGMESFLLSLPGAALFKVEETRSRLAVIPLNEEERRAFLSPEEKALNTHPVSAFALAKLQRLAEMLSDYPFSCGTVFPEGELPFLQISTDEGKEFFAYCIPDRDEDESENFILHLAREFSVPVRGRKETSRRLSEWQSSHDLVSAALSMETGNLSMMASIPVEKGDFPKDETMNFILSFLRETESFPL